MKADVLIGGAPCNDPNQIACVTTSATAPFGNDQVSGFQQIYSSTDFSAPMSITGLQFYVDPVDGLPNVLDPGSYSIYLDTTGATAANANNPSGTLFAQGTDATLGTIQSQGGGDVLTIMGTTPFTYDPGTGNLVLSVEFATANSGCLNNYPGGCSFTLALQTTADSSVSFDVVDPFGNDITGATLTSSAPGQTGLITDFLTPAAVPEPSSLLLLAALLVMATIVATRKKAPASRS